MYLAMCHLNQYFCNNNINNNNNNKILYDTVTELKLRLGGRLHVATKVVCLK